MFQPERLREAMFRAKLNAVQLAKASGVSRNTIGLLLDGKGNPRSSTLEAIARQLNTTTAAFFVPDAQYIEQASTPAAAS